jgi:DNA-binding MarR family transcriptional regulator
MGEGEGVTSKPASSLSEEDYTRLLRFRTELRRFEDWSRTQALQAGLTPAQHQLLLAVRGHGEPLGPTIGEVAEYLFVRHHSVVELVDRAVDAGIVARGADPADARVVRLTLTELGGRRLEQLSHLHLGELARLAPLFHHLAPEGADLS